MAMQSLPDRRQGSAGARAFVPITNPSRADAPAAQSALQGQLLLATDGTPPAVAATAITAALAARWQVAPHVLTVLPPPVPIDPMFPTLLPPAEAGELVREQVANQLAASFPADCRWVHDVVVGSPVEEIARAAQAADVGLVVLGLRLHTLLDRVFRDETALSVMRHACAPVLAVTPTLRGLPRRIAVAIDFSRASIAAARAAAALLQPGGELLLVYVEPSAGERTDGREGYGVIYAQGLSAAFVRLRRELSTRTDITPETVVLQGHVAPELLSFARGADVDVIAVGSQRHSITHRAFVGSVTAALARAAERSLLVIPPSRRG
jgi:nucleotide-binding universal stress UspA family protein